jgi:hypothetical protein
VCFVLQTENSLAQKRAFVKSCFTNETKSFVSNRGFES